MNTAVSYRTPSHRNKYGKYESNTYCRRLAAGYSQVHVRIALVWFSRMGWYYIVAIEAEALNPALKSIRELETSGKHWRQGPELPLCAEAAEEMATQLLNVHDLGPLAFNPYELKVEGEFDEAAWRAKYNLDMRTK